MRRATERRCRCERFMRLSAAHDLPGGRAPKAAETMSQRAGIAWPEALEEDFESPRGTGDANVLEAETTCERLASETRSRSVVRVDEAESRGGQPKWLSAATWPRNRSPHQTERSKAKVLGTNATLCTKSTRLGGSGARGAVHGSEEGIRHPGRRQDPVHHSERNGWRVLWGTVFTDEPGAHHSTQCACVP